MSPRLAAVPRTAAHRAIPIAPATLVGFAGPALTAALTAVLAVGLTVLAGCGPDRVTAPHHTPPPSGPSADLATLTSAPILYDQRSSRIAKIGSGSPGFLEAADFVVPSGGWTVGHVELSGTLYGSALTFAIRADNAGVPGAEIQSFTLAPAATDPNSCCPVGYITDYLFRLPTPVSLTAGTYWLAVRMASAAGGSEWEWQVLPSLVGGPLKGSLNGGGFWGTASTTEDVAFVLFGPVVQQAQAITFPALTPDPATLGGTATLAATATSGLAVGYTSLTTDVCTLSGSTLSYVGVGTCTVAADQAGDASSLPADRVTRDVAVGYQFAGFAQPVDNGGVLNVAKAGQAIALKWRLTDAAGLPVTTLTAATATAASLACSLATAGDQVEEYAASTSGLQNLGDGYYQLNWKSPATYAKSCRTLKLDLGEGSGPRTALFQFTK